MNRRSTALAAAAWSAGLGLLIMPLANSSVGILWGLGSALVVGALATWGVHKSKIWPVDAALGGTVAVAILSDTTAVMDGGTPWVLTGLCLAALGHTLIQLQVRSPRIPLPVALRQAIPTLLLAAVTTIFVIWGPRWVAPFVSSRWANSVDAASAPFVSLVGLAILAFAAAAAAFRVHLRRRAASTDS